MNNYRKTFPYLTITGLLLFVVGCNPLHPDIVEDPMIIVSNPAPNQPNAQIAILFDAIDKGDIKNFQDTWIQLKAANPMIVFSQFIDEFGNTFLHRAAEKGNKFLLEFLLFYSIDKDTYIDAVNYLDQTPLHIAVMHKHLDSIEWLIAAGADPTVYDSEGFMPLHTAIIDGNLDIVERLTQGNNVIALIDLPTKVEGYSYTAIRLAYMKKHTDMLKHFMHLKYYKSNQKLTGVELLIVLEYEWVDLIEDLIKEKRIEVNQKGILQLAANKGCLPLVKYLTDQLGQDPNEIYATPHKDMTNTAAYQAVRGSHLKPLHYLLQQGARPHIDVIYDAYNSDLLGIALETYIKHKQKAIRTQDATTLNATHNEVDKKLSDAKKVIDLILASRRANFDLPITRTLLGNKKRYTFSPEILKLASEAGLDIFKLVLSHSYASDRKKIVTASRDGYYSPIHSASEAGDTKLVEYLLSMNADVNTKSPTGTTPLMHAVKSGNIETVQYLITKRATVNAKGEHNHTALYEAIKGGRQDIVELLLNHGARIHDEENDGNTLLHAAAWENDVSSIQEIIARIGVKRINVKDSFGYTPLHYAAQIGNQASVNTLLASGADIHAENEEGKTPLELSIESKHPAVTKQLIAAGTNLNKYLSGYDQDKTLKLILFLLKNEEGTLGGNGNIEIIDKLIRKVDKITLIKLVTNVLTANSQNFSPQEKFFWNRLMKEYNIQLTDCLASIICDNQTNYKLNSKESSSSLCRLIEGHGLHPFDCMYQLILSKKPAANPLLYYLIDRYKVSPLYMLHEAVKQGREDIASLIIGPCYKSIKNIIVKQCVATNDCELMDRLIRNNKNNVYSENLTCIISQAIKLSRVDIIKQLITRHYVDARIVVANVIYEIEKEISNSVHSHSMQKTFQYITDMRKLVQHLMETNSLQPQDIAIWAAETNRYETVKYILTQYDLTPEQLIDQSEQMNNDQAVSFLKGRFSRGRFLNRGVTLGNSVSMLTNSSYDISRYFSLTKRQKRQ